MSHSCATAQNQQLIAEIQRQSGWDVRLVIPARWRDAYGNRLDEPPWPGLESAIVRVPVWANGRIILHWYRRSWRRLLQMWHPDIIYVNHEPYALATAQIVRANRATLRCPIGFYSAQNLNKQYPFPFSRIEATVYQDSLFAFPITEAVGKVLRDKGFSGDLCVAPLALDPSAYNPGLRRSPPSNMTQGEGPKIGFVGRLTEAKGLKTLASALSLMRTEPWQLVLVGTGDLESDLREALSSAGLLDRVQFAGYIPHQETARWLAAFDILVLPSETRPNWTEQFGRVIPEALACGTAVIGSDSGEIPNLIHSSRGGLVFPEGDAAALAAALRELIWDTDLREAAARSGRAWVEAEIALEAVARRMVETLGRAASGPRPLPKQRPLERLRGIRRR